jgi:hypothetical protein
MPIVSGWNIPQSLAPVTLKPKFTDEPEREKSICLGE